MLVAIYGKEPNLNRKGSHGQISLYIVSKISNTIKEIWYNDSHTKLVQDCQFVSVKSGEGEEKLYLVSASRDTMCNVWHVELPLDEIEDGEFSCLDEDRDITRVHVFAEHTKSVTMLRTFKSNVDGEYYCASADQSGIVHVRFFFFFFSEIF